VAQAVEGLLCKCEALSSILHSHQKTKTRRSKRKKELYDFYFYEKSSPTDDGLYQEGNI
jgi:hypothetical protein